MDSPTEEELIMVYQKAPKFRFSTPEKRSQIETYGTYLFQEWENKTLLVIEKAMEGVVKAGREWEVASGLLGVI